jgi:hypothetical protein
MRKEGREGGKEEKGRKTEEKEKDGHTKLQS